MNDQSLYEYVPVRPSLEGLKTLILRVVIGPEGTTWVEVLEPSGCPPPEERGSR
jgi:hypothetical protein